METVGVRELRQYATRVLARVRRGETVGVTDRGVLVAQISPVRSDPWERLLNAGELLLPEDPLPLSEVAPLPALATSLSEILAEQRRDER